MSSFVKHQVCVESDRGCIVSDVKGIRFHCERFGSGCAYANADRADRRHIFEQRDTDQESRLDRRARARECK